MNLKEKIHLLAKEKGISIPTLERKAGLGKSTISKWDKSSPTIEKLQAVADVLGVPVSRLLDSPYYTLDLQHFASSNDNELSDDRFEGMDTQEILENLATRDEMRVLFSLTKDATREDILRTIKIIEALKEKSDL